MNAETVLLVLALGWGCGLGLWALAVWLFPPRPTLGALLHRVTSPPPTASTAATASPATGLLGARGGRWEHRLGAPWQALGLPEPALVADLALLQRPTATHLAAKTIAAVTGLLAPALTVGVVALLGADPGVAVPAAVSLAAAVFGFFVPDMRVRARARRLRTEFRHGLSAYLDLTWITLAGGAGIDSAVRDAAAVGHGWVFTRLRSALDAAQLTRTTPWTSLRRLGDDTGVTELAELAASVSLAGTEGARVRASLAAKAQALRTHELTRCEGDAHAATERLALPVTVLFLGFLIFIGYPAVSLVLTGL